MKPKNQKVVLCPRHSHQHQHHHHHHHHHAHEHPIHKVECSEDDEDEDMEVLTKNMNAIEPLLSSKSPTIQETKFEVELELDSDINLNLKSVQEQRKQLVERLRVYNNLLKFHKAIKEDQVFLYRKLQEMDELYLRNTAAILRLGFCPCLVHRQTSTVGDRLMKIHRNLRVWDRKLEKISDSIKESSSKKSASAVLHILQICDTKLGKIKSDFSDVDLPEIVWELENPFLDDIDIPALIDEWRAIRIDVRDSLCKAELKFQEVCLEFGIRRGPAEAPKRNCYNYIVTDDVDEVEEGEGDGDETGKSDNDSSNECVDTNLSSNSSSNCKISSSFL